MLPKLDFFLAANIMHKISNDPAQISDTTFIPILNGTSLKSCSISNTNKAIITIVSNI
jgi:hypothetical protein